MGLFFYDVGIIKNDIPQVPVKSSHKVARKVITDKLPHIFIISNLYVSARGSIRFRPSSSAELFGRHGRTAEHLILTKNVNMVDFCEIR